MTTETMDAAIRYEVDADGICTLTLDLPGEKMNVLGGRLTTPLDEACQRAVADAAVKGIVITSGKPAFVAGGDLKAMGEGFDYSSLSKGEIAYRLGSLSRMLRALEQCGKPVACAINGTALGGGFEIALACHYRVVADDPEIQLGLPEANVGLMPGAGGTQRVIRLVGVKAALPLLMQGKILKPADALAAGLVHEISPVGEIVTAAKRWLRAGGDPVQPWDKKGYVIPGPHSTLEREFRGIFSGSNAMVRANGLGNYPAPELISSVIYEGAMLPMDKALGIESKYFSLLRTGDVSRNLIRTMFVNKGRADRLEARPEGIEKLNFRRIGVVGAGLMGGGIAFAAAKAGMEVVLIDRDQESADRGKDYARKKLARDVEKGRSTQDKMDAVLARIKPTTDYAELGDVQMAIETVFEDFAVKSEVLPRIEAAIPADAFIGSNTSRMPITRLAGSLAAPERLVGMHFFSPAERMPLIEIIRGTATGAQALAHALDFAQAVRKTPVLVNDSFGFFTSRFIGSFVGQSLAMLNEGVSPALIENGARMLGMPMGALSISDLMGLDTGYKAAQQEARDRGEEPPITISSRLVTEFGRLGSKVGKGYFDYGEDGSKRIWPGLAALLPTLSEQPSIDEVKARILYAQLAEGARAFAEGVLVDAMSGDLGACLGVGFPAYLGGPFAAMDTIGVPQVIVEADRLAGRYGEAFALPKIVRDMADRGETFHGATAVLSPGAMAT